MDWKAKSAELYARYPLSSVDGKAGRFLVDAVAAGRTLAVGCSGGADSVFVALWCFGFCQEYEAGFSLAHFDHCQRGSESDGDVEFVRQISDGLGAGFLLGKFDGASASEADLRKARFGFFGSELDAAAVVVLGHHLDDVMENWLMRLARGSSLAGLASPLAVKDFDDGFTVCRPLLGLTSEAIRSALRELEIPWKEDSSNDSEDYYRNRIRSKVIPEWEKAAPNHFRKGASQSAKLLVEDAELIEWSVGSVLRDFNLDSGELRVADIRKFPRALVRRILLAWIEIQLGENPLNANAMDVLIDGLLSDRPFKSSASDRQFFSCDGQVLKLETKESFFGEEKAVSLAAGETMYFPNGSSLKCSWVELDSVMRSKIFAGEYSHERTVFLRLYSKQAFDFTVRKWRMGDAYRPFGQFGVKKLQDLFTNRKISRVQRHKLPIVCMDGEILWVPHLPPSHDWIVDRASTEALQLTYEPRR